MCGVGGFWDQNQFSFSQETWHNACMEALLDCLSYHLPCHLPGDFKETTTKRIKAWRFYIWHRKHYCFDLLVSEWFTKLQLLLNY